MATRRRACRTIRRCANGSELSLGNQVAVLGKHEKFYYRATVTGFPINSDKVEVTFDDGVKTSINLTDVSQRNISDIIANVQDDEGLPLLVAGDNSVFENADGEDRGEEVANMEKPVTDNIVQKKALDISEGLDQEKDVSDIIMDSLDGSEEEIDYDAPILNSSNLAATSSRMLDKMDATSSDACSVEGPDLDDSDCDPNYSESSSSDEDEEEYPKRICGDLIKKLVPANTRAVVASAKVPAIEESTCVGDEGEGEDSTSSNIGKKGVTVQFSNSSPNIRVYDKRYFCPYCEQPQSKLPRHMISQHANEKDIVTYLTCADKTIKSAILTKLRNLGNHQHNTKIIRSGVGELNVIYRPKYAPEDNKYIPCQHCLGYYAKRDLWKHATRCELNLEKGLSVKGIKRHHLAAGKMLLPTSSDTSFKLHKVLTTMNNDDIALVVRNDSVILRLGEQLVSKHGHDRNKFSHIRNKLRELGRYLVELRKTSCSLHCLNDFINPKCFRYLIEAAKTVAGFDSSTNTFKIPSLAMKLGGTIGKCANIAIADGIEKKDDERKKMARDLKTLIDMRWGVELSVNALRNLVEAKRNVIQVVPLSTDVQRLTAFLKDNIASLSALLISNNSNRTAYFSLQKALLALLILFNRRRSGEVSRMTLKDYYGAHSSGESDELGFSPMEKALISVLQRVEIEGKRGRTVPVLMTKLMTSALELLVKCRGSVGISPDNVYAFAASMGLNCIRGSDTLRLYSEQCGAKRPEALRSTKLRKHIATMTQVLNLDDNELDILANFMGHDIRIHREYYRLPEKSTQLAKVSKILYAMESGSISKHAGKKLVDIDIDLNGELEVGDDEDDDELMEKESVSECEETETNQNYQEHSSSSVEGAIGSKDGPEVNIENSVTGGRKKLVKTARLEAKSKKSTGERRPWSKDEVNLLKTLFSKHITIKTLPGKREIEEFSAKYGWTREWRNIKYYVKYLSLK